MSTGPAATPQEAAWRAERRRLVRTHHPDAGGSAVELEAALAAHDLARPGRPAPAPLLGQVTVVSTRRGRAPVRRRVRRLVAAVRTKVPRAFPGARRHASY